MFEKELNNYINIFNNDIEEIRKDLVLIENAIRFIIKENLYEKFLKFQVERRQEDYEREKMNKDFDKKYNY